jgi:hypothetical protein
MAPPSPKHVELARRIVEEEAARSPDREGPTAAAEAACRQLAGHLADLLGAGGVSALLGRALRLAHREDTSLAGVTVSVEPDVCFAGLEDSLVASTDDQATAAATTILAHMLEVLVMLLGEELGMKPIRKLWPRLTTAGEIDE